MSRNAPQRPQRSELFQLKALAYFADSHRNVQFGRFLVRDGAWIHRAGVNTVRIYGGLQITSGGTVKFGVSDSFLLEAAAHGLWVIVGT